MKHQPTGTSLGSKVSLFAVDTPEFQFLGWLRNATGNGITTFRSGRAASDGAPVLPLGDGGPSYDSGLSTQTVADFYRRLSNANLDSIVLLRLIHEISRVRALVHLDNVRHDFRAKERLELSFLYRP
jgi:hypothetical protein